VVLNASASNDPDGEVVSYRWELNSMNLSGPVLRYSFVQPGDYSVKLIVTDNLGGTAIKTETVKVRKENTAQAFSSESKEETSILPWVLALILLGALAVLYWRWHEQEDFLIKKLMELEKGKKEKPATAAEEEIEIVEVPEEGKGEVKDSDFKPPEEKEKEAGKRGSVSEEKGKAEKGEGTPEETVEKTEKEKGEALAGETKVKEDEGA